MCLNGAHTKKVPIERVVKQVCPLTPYLFLFVGEELNAATKHRLHSGILYGIQLLNNYGQQLLIQYANDTNFTLRGLEDDLRATTLLLNQF